MPFPLEPATLRLEYRWEPAPRRLTCLWTTRAASGQTSRTLDAEDLAAIAQLTAAVSRPGGEWRTLSSRVAALLLDGIGPLDSVRRIVIATPAASLQSLPFEILGTPPLIERFTVWYEPGGASSGTFTPLWPVPPEASSRFMARFQGALTPGISKAEALRRVKTDLLRSGAHPFYWASFVLHGEGASAIPARLPWTWLFGFGLLIPSVVFLLWWRRRRFELL